jgi:hypothetical protein
MNPEPLPGYVWLEAAPPQNKRFHAWAAHLEFRDDRNLPFSGVPADQGTFPPNVPASPATSEAFVRLLLIGLGGGVGSILRYLLSGMVQSGEGGSAFPAGTLAVNLLGCLVIGALTELSEARGWPSYWLRRRSAPRSIAATSSSR